MGAIEKIEKVSELTLDKLGEICQEENVTVRKVCQLLYDGMNADIIKLDTEGDELSRVPDMGTRHKYMQSAMEMLRLVKKETIDVAQVAVVHKMAPEDIDRLEAIAKELRGLENRLLTDKIQQGRVIEVVSISGGSITPVVNSVTTSN